MHCLNVDAYNIIYPIKLLDSVYECAFPGMK